ncbi:MAG: NAD-dependent epimerase/dehydratase family protein [Chitinophagia bacterium]|nr:NAD-dependent epimerase/dehydratase family protein [Chitinophagia bacterium]
MIKLDCKKTYLITGASGFLGKALVDRLTSLNILNIRALSRDEGALISLKQAFPHVDIYSGDVSDPFEVQQAMKNINGVFHLAASKHVGLAETFVRENIKTNTIGSLNIYEQSLKQDLDFILSISTDKAAQVSGVYGATKLLMERLSSQYEKLNPSCQYRIVRYGNVLYSTGSVLCKWKELISQGKEVVVTEPDATRFFWTVDQAVDLIMDCMENATDSTPYCPSMKSMKISDLLQAMIVKYSRGQHISIKVIGLQKGENMHEKVLDSGPFSNEVDHFSIEEILDLI